MRIDERRARKFHHLWGKGAKLVDTCCGWDVLLEEAGVNVEFYLGGEVGLQTCSRQSWHNVPEFLNEHDKVLFLVRKVVEEGEDSNGNR